jgi:hypothetical protein
MAERQPDAGHVYAGTAAERPEFSRPFGQGRFSRPFIHDVRSDLKSVNQIVTTFLLEDDLASGHKAN